MYWSEEDSFTVLPRNKLITGDKKGDKCSIKIRCHIHEGEILGVGKYFIIIIKFIKTAIK